MPKTHTKSRKTSRKTSKKTSKKGSIEGYYNVLKDYTFPNLDVTKYVDPTGFEKRAKLPDLFLKMIQNAYKKIKFNYDPKKFMGVEGVTIKVSPKKSPSVPFGFFSFGTPETPTSYSRSSSDLIFNVIHFSDVPKEIDPFKISFYQKKRTKNKLFGRYEYIKTADEISVQSGLTLVIPNGTYIKFNKVYSTNQKINLIKVLWFQCVI